jgi:putative transposase
MEAPPKSNGERDILYERDVGRRRAAALVSRARTRPKDAPTFVASIPLEVTMSQVRTITARFEGARRIYNACLGEALKRARWMRADMRWAHVKAISPDDPARSAKFRELRREYGFTEQDLMSYASGCRVSWLRELVFAQEAQVLGRRAYEAVNRWVIGERGRPRFKSVSRGLHSLEAKDLTGALRIGQTSDGRAGLQWRQGFVLPFRLDEADPCHRWAALHVAAGRLLRCRITRTRIQGRWTFRAQLVLDGVPLQRYEPGRQLVGLDIGPSEIAVVSDHGAFKETFCAELADQQREIRRLQRRLDRQHRAGSPSCYDERGRHRKGGCDWWRARSKRADQTIVDLADAQRRLAEHRESLHGNLANRILGQGTVIKTEKISYRAFQRAFGLSVARRAPGTFMTMLTRKAASAGGKVIDVNTWSTALSQTCVCGAQERKPLSQRVHVCRCGVVADRDVLAGFLVRHVDTTNNLHRLDAESAHVEWARRDDIRGWPVSRCSNRRVPPAVPVGHGKPSEPVGHTGISLSPAKTPRRPAGPGAAA